MSEKAIESVELVIVHYLRQEPELCLWKIGGLNKSLSFPTRDFPLRQSIQKHIPQEQPASLGNEKNIATWE